MELVDRGVTVIAAGSRGTRGQGRDIYDTDCVYQWRRRPKVGPCYEHEPARGNVTGISFLVDERSGKQLGLLHDLVPNVGTIAALLNPGYDNALGQLKGVQDAANAFGLKLEVMEASTERDIDAFPRMVEVRVGALVVFSDPFLFARHEKIVALAAAHALPAIYTLREFVGAGGLMSYHTNIPDAYRHGGIYVGRILKGEKPGDLPIVQPTKYELVINLKTAKALGLTIPPNPLALADEVIE